MGYRRRVHDAKRAYKRRKKTIKIEEYSSVNCQCLKKVPYHSEKKVISKIKEIAEEGRLNLRYYLCPFCECYHISHKAIGNQKFIS